MYESINLQDAILHEVMEEKVPVDLFLEGGQQIGGIIVAYDSFVIVLISNGRQHMIYKHSIFAMAPIRPLKAAMYE